MASFSQLFEDPMAAIGYGLLTSGQNPVGAAMGVMQQAEQSKRQREQDNLRKLMIQYKMQKIDKPTENEKQYNALIERGYDDKAAYALANGFIKGIPDPFGNVHIKNLMDYGRSSGADSSKSDGVPNPAPRQSGLGNDGSAGEFVTLPEDTEPNKEQPPSFARDIKESTGLYNRAGDTISAALDIALNKKGADPDSSNSAKTRIKAFNQLAKGALVNNPRFPVSEQKIASEILVDADAFLTSPGRQLEKAAALKKILEDTRRLMQEDLRSGNITMEQRGLYANKISEMDRALAMMGDLNQAQRRSMPSGEGSSGGGNPLEGFSAREK